MERSKTPLPERPQEPKLLDQVRTACRTRHLSLRTERAYVQWNRRYVHFHGLQHPRMLGEGDVRAFLSHLATVNQVAASTQTQALPALLFLYKSVLDRPLGDLGTVVRAKRPNRLPAVPSKVKVQAVLDHLNGTPRLVASLWLGEAVWFPTALLPGGAVHWEAVDDSTARAVVSDGVVRISGDFHFAPSGEITRFTVMRYRDANGTMVLTPFEGRYGAYERYAGVMIPGQAEVAWQLPDGRYPYWRGHPEEVDFEYRSP